MNKPRFSVGDRIIGFAGYWKGLGVGTVVREEYYSKNYDMRMVGARFDSYDYSNDLHNCHDTVDSSQVRLLTKLEKALK